MAVELIIGITAAVISGIAAAGVAAQQKTQTEQNVGDFNTGGSSVPAITTGEGAPTGEHGQGKPTVWIFNGQTYTSQQAAQDAQDAWVKAHPSGSGAEVSGAGTSAGTSQNPNPQGQSEADIAKERYAEAQTSIGEMQGQLDQTVLAQKVAEVQAEGGITASTAARGLKMEGSPLMQLIAQQQAGKSAIGYTEQQGAAVVMGARTGAQASYDAAALSGKEQIQYADQQLSNAWLGLFTGVMNTAAKGVDKFWQLSSSSSDSYGGVDFSEWS
jgi:hypothetical protein